MRIPDMTFILIFTVSLFWNSARCQIRTDREKWACSSVGTIQ